MTAEQHTTIGGARDLDREWSRLIDDLARRGFLCLPGAADALLGRGRPTAGQTVETGADAAGR